MTNNFLLSSQLLIMPGHESLIPELLLFNIYLRYKMEFFTNASVKKKKVKFSMYPYLPWP